MICFSQLALRTMKVAYAFIRSLTGPCRAAGIQPHSTRLRKATSKATGYSGKSPAPELCIYDGACSKVPASNQKIRSSGVNVTVVGMHVETNVHHNVRYVLSIQLRLRSSNRGPFSPNFMWPEVYNPAAALFSGVFQAPTSVAGGQHQPSDTCPDEQISHSIKTALWVLHGGEVKLLWIMECYKNPVVVATSWVRQYYITEADYDPFSYSLLILG